MTTINIDEKKMEEYIKKLTETIKNKYKDKIKYTKDQWLVYDENRCRWVKKPSIRDKISKETCIFIDNEKTNIKNALHVKMMYNDYTDVKTVKKQRETKEKSNTTIEHITDKCDIIENNCKEIFKDDVFKEKIDKKPFISFKYSKLIYDTEKNEFRKASIDDYISTNYGAYHYCDDCCLYYRENLEKILLSSLSLENYNKFISMIYDLFVKNDKKPYVFINIPLFIWRMVQNLFEENMIYVDFHSIYSKKSKLLEQILEKKIIATSTISPIFIKNYNNIIESIDKKVIINVETEDGDKKVKKLDNFIKENNIEYCEFEKDVEIYEREMEDFMNPFISIVIESVL